jgi:hypothetical protein
MIVKDLEDGKNGEKRVKKTLEEMGYECEFNSDKTLRSDYDLIITGIGTVEIKNDLYSGKSGNVAIEYYNPKSDKPSGINITKSDIWCHIISGVVYVVKTEDLRNFVNTAVPKRDIKKAGDGNASLKLYTIEHIMTILVPIEEIGGIICGLSGKKKSKKNLSS